MNTGTRRNRTSVQRIAACKQALEKQKQAKVANQKYMSPQPNSPQEGSVRGPESPRREGSSGDRSKNLGASFRLHVLATAAVEQKQSSITIGRETVFPDVDEGAHNSLAQPNRKRRFVPIEPEAMCKSDEENCVYGEHVVGHISHICGRTSSTGFQSPLLSSAPISRTTVIGKPDLLSSDN